MLPGGIHITGRTLLCWEEIRNNSHSAYLCGLKNPLETSLHTEGIRETDIYTLCFFVTDINLISLFSP